MNYRFTTKEFQWVSTEIFRTASRTCDSVPNKIIGQSDLYYFEAWKLLRSNASIRFPPNLQDFLFPEKFDWESVYDYIDEKGTNAGFQVMKALSNLLRAVMMIERIRLLFSSLGCKKQPNPVAYAKYITYWYVLYRDGKAEKVAKFQSVSAFNNLFKVEPLPGLDLPFGWKEGCLGFGAYREYERYLFKIFPSFGRRKQFRLGQSYLYFKKGCPPVSSSYICESLIKHQTVLTNPKSITISGIDRKLSLRFLKERAHLVCSEVLKDFRFQEVMWDPSLNASYSNPRHKGGQMGDLTMFSSCSQNNLFLNPFTNEYPCTCGNFDFYFNGKTVVKVPGRECIHVDYSKIYAELEELKARPVGLTEPLKVRTITCEPPNITFLLKGLQLSLWKCLKNHPTFRLVGTPVQECDIPVGEYPWLSVDYSAATDEFSSEFSEIMTEAISRCIGFPKEIMLKSLTGHLLDYSKIDCLPDEFRKVCEQRNGQLMGSILSFIVLCLGNAVICSLALEPVDFTSLASLPLLINGDDGLMLADRSTVLRWEDWSMGVGLKPSVGKVYYSKDFCVINSELFYYNKSGIVRKCPYANANYLQFYDGRTFSRPKEIADLGVMQRGWLSGFKNSEKPAADDLFFREFDVFLKSPDLKGRNWYLDRSVGGLGLDYTFRKLKSYEVSRTQLAFIAKSLEGGLYDLPFRRFLKGYDGLGPERQTWIQLVRKPRCTIHTIVDCWNEKETVMRKMETLMRRLPTTASEICSTHALQEILTNSSLTERNRLIIDSMTSALRTVDSPDQSMPWDSPLAVELKRLTGISLLALILQGNGRWKSNLGALMKIKSRSCLEQIVTSIKRVDHDALISWLNELPRSQNISKFGILNRSTLQSFSKIFCATHTGRNSKKLTELPRLCERDYWRSAVVKEELTSDLTCLSRISVQSNVWTACKPLSFSVQNVFSMPYILLGRSLDLRIPTVRLSRIVFEQEEVPPVLHLPPESIRENERSM